MDLIQGSGSVCVPSLRAVKAVLRSPSSLPHRSHQLSTIIFCGGEFACIEAGRLGSNLQVLAQLEDKLAAPTSIEMYVAQYQQITNVRMTKLHAPQIRLGRRNAGFAAAIHSPSITDRSDGTAPESGPTRVNP